MTGDRFAYRDVSLGLVMAMSIIGAAGIYLERYSVTILAVMVVFGLCVGTWVKIDCNIMQVSNLWFRETAARDEVAEFYLNVDKSRSGRGRYGLNARLCDGREVNVRALDDFLSGRGVTDGDRASVLDMFNGWLGKK